jgi:hypothetical protein
MNIGPVLTGERESDVKVERRVQLVHHIASPLPQYTRPTLRVIGRS